MFFFFYIFKHTKPLSDCLCLTSADHIQMTVVNVIFHQSLLIMISERYNLRDIGLDIIVFFVCFESVFSN